MPTKLLVLNKSQSELSPEMFIKYTIYYFLKIYILSLLLNSAVDIELPNDVSWFKANINGTGFYRVNYPKENWDALINALMEDHTVFSTSDRAQLINDAFALSQ